ncbi:MAG: hypothetical protein HQK53_12815 [Oligoflexia bacterium]|nr:hypothetical protein [Oligoflexia bacterium]
MKRQTTLKTGPHRPKTKTKRKHPPCLKSSPKLSINEKQYYLYSIKERTKELECMYNVAKIITAAKGLNEIFTDVADIIPSGWQWPEKTSCRIYFDDEIYLSTNFKESIFKQSSSILVNDKPRGKLEIFVSSISSKTSKSKEIFLKEEQKLVDSIARTLSTLINAHHEKNQLNAQLLHADRLSTIGQLAAGITHELSEPIGNILGFAQLVLGSKTLSPENKNDIYKIEKAALYARGIIKKLMTFARQDLGQGKMLDLNTLLNDVVFLFESRCEKEGIVLKIKFDKKSPKIIADGGQIQQVVVNLVVNAIQAMPDGGELLLQSVVNQKEVMIMVKDTGIGMSTDTLQKIFLPFFTTKDINEGTGLGLAVVYGIIQSHKGKINVHSFPGEGSTFEIILPLANL